MTAEEKALKARDILNSNPTDEDVQIVTGLVRDAVADNNARAMHLLAQMHHYGTGVEKDDKQALELCKKAVNGGCVEAKLLLAQLYMEGEATEKDALMAKACLESLMEQNDARAYYQMGLYVWDDEFPNINDYSAFDYIEKAANLGLTQAMTFLGQTYGRLCETELSDYWFTKAEKAGAEGIEQLREELRNGDDYDERLENAVKFYFSKGMYDKGFRLLERDSKADIRAAKYLLAGYSLQGAGNEAYGKDVQRAICIYKELSDEGDAYAGYMLGHIYWIDEDVKDGGKAVAYLRAAAEAGQPDAQCALAWIYCVGEITPQNKAEGKRLLEAAAEQGHGWSLYLLASCYLQDGDVSAEDWKYNPGYEQDAQKGMEYLRRAAEVDDARALSCLARCYKQGKYTEKDENKAFELLNRSCSINANPYNVGLLGQFYRDGIGTAQDIKMAKALYDKALAGGCEEALYAEVALCMEGEEGVEEPDYDKAIELVRPYAKEGNAWGCFVMAMACDSKCISPNGYSRDLAHTAAHYMEKAAEGGFERAMLKISEWYTEGRGVPFDPDKAKEWLRKYVETEDCGEDRERFNNMLSLSDEVFEDQAFNTMYSYWHGIVGANKEKIKDWQDYMDEEENVNVNILTRNAAQLGELNALFLVGNKALELLKTDPDEAKRLIEITLEQGFEDSAFKAGMEWLKETDQNEEAASKAMEYFNMGAVRGVGQCRLHAGILLTSEGLEEDLQQLGKAYLEQVSKLKGDDWEEERKLAQERLKEIELRSKPLITRALHRCGKFIAGLCKGEE